MSAAQKYWDFLRTCDLLWLGNINSLTSEFPFLVVASLCSLQIVAKQDTTHTAHYFFFYFSWLLFSLSETWKKIIVGWQNDCSTWKFGMEKDTLSIPFNIQCSKAGKKWHLEREVLSTLEVNNFLGGSPPILLLDTCAEGVQFYWTLSSNSLLHYFFIFKTLCTLVGKWNFFIEMNPKEHLEIKKKELSKVKRWF